MTISISIKNRHSFAHNRFPGEDGLPKGTAPFADIRSQDILTRLTKRLLSRDSGYRLSRLVKGCNAPIPIHGKDALGDRVKDYVPFLVVHIINIYL